MKKLLVGGLGLSVGLLANAAAAQEATGNRPTSRPAVLIARPEPLPRNAQTAPAAALARPVALGTQPAASPVASAFADRMVRQVSFSGLASPRPVVRAQSPDYGLGPYSDTGGWTPSVTPVIGKHQVPAPAPPPSADPFFPAPVPQNPIPGPGGAPYYGPPPAAGPFSPAPGCGPCGDSWWGSRWSLQSDHCFDNFISPVTNPFLFEDPRALTELRPIFMYQTVPDNNAMFRGGDIEYIGVQARLAVTDRLSFIITKLGGLFINPGDGAGIDSRSGFSEVHLGPKYTFLRNEDTYTLGAFGLTFQIPAGDSEVFQDTGDFSIVPYFSFAQNFWRTSYGSFNFMSTTGYAFGMNDQRTDQFFTSLHLDYDIANLHRFYPLLELHWFNYPSAGSVQPLDFEGRDLINFGSTGVGGNNTLSIAPGFRWKFSEAAQVGVAAEFPLNGRRDLLDFRFTIDFIWRY